MRNHMKRRTILFFLIISITVMISGCGSRGGKISNKKFEKILDAYLEYYKDEVRDQYEECYGKMIINTDGMPMLMVYGQTSYSYEAMLLSWSKGEVRSLFECDCRDVGAVNVLSDGLLTVRENESLVTLYLIGKEPDEIGYINSEKEEAEITYEGRNLTLKYQADQEEYRAFADEIFDIQYGGKLKPDETDYQMNIFHFSDLSGNQPEETFYRSVPLVTLTDYDEESIFDYKHLKRQISALQEAGSMTQEEFIIWNAQYYEGEKDECALAFKETVVARNPMLLNEFDFSMLDSKQIDEVRMEVLDYIIVNAKEKSMSEIDVMSNMSEDELTELLRRRFREIDLVSCLNEYRSDMITAEESEGEENSVELTESDRLDKKTITDIHLKKKAIEGWNKIMQGRSGQDAMKAYRNLSTNLPEQMEKWKSEYEGSDEMMVDAYKYYLEHSKSVSGTSKEDANSCSYAFCRAGEDRQLCLIEYLDYGVDGWKNLYVYDGENYIFSDGFWAARTGGFWLDEIKGWYVHGSCGAATGIEYLATVKDGKVKVLFAGYYDFWDNHFYEMEANGDMSEISLDEYNESAMELLGKPLLTEDGRSGEIEADPFQHASFTDYYDTIDEAYDRLLEIESE